MSTTKTLQPLPLTLAPDVWDQLHALVKWVDERPVDVRLSDSTWEGLHEQTTEPIDELLGDEGWCAEVVTEGNELVALVVVTHETDPDVELRIAILRGASDPVDAK